MRVAWLGADAVANALPVVFCRRGNSVSVIAHADLIGCLELLQRVFHGGKLGIPTTLGWSAAAIFSAVR